MRDGAPVFWGFARCPDSKYINYGRAEFFSFAGGKICTPELSARVGASVQVGGMPWEMFFGRGEMAFLSQLTI
jgi:hypothetical protein